MNRRGIALLAAGHFLTDLCQGAVPALLPFLVAERHFSYTAAASLVFAMSASSSVVQPLFGQVADRFEVRWLLPVSLMLTGSGLALGAQSRSFEGVLAAFTLSGLGLAAFHPEAARQAHHASGARRATGMSLFTVGGVVGFALAPVLTTALVVTCGTPGMLVFLVPTLIVAALINGQTAASHYRLQGDANRDATPILNDWLAFFTLSGATICRSIVFFGLNTFLSLYFMSRWSLSAAKANMALAVFLGTSIVGTLLGGWLADRFGRRSVMRAGFGGALVFLPLFVLTPERLLAMSLLIPLAIFIFLPASVQVVLGQEYLPGRVGMASGMTLGLAVSVGGMVAPLLGRLADERGVASVFIVLIGVIALALILTFQLPSPVGLQQRLQKGRFRASQGEPSEVPAPQS